MEIDELKLEEEQLLLSIQRKDISFLVFDDNYENLLNKINDYGGRIVHIFGTNAFVIKFPNNSKNKLSQLNVLIKDKLNLETDIDVCKNKYKFSDHVISLINGYKNNQNKRKDFIDKIQTNRQFRLDYIANSKKTIDLKIKNENVNNNNDSNDNKTNNTDPQALVQPPPGVITTPQVTGKMLRGHVLCIFLFINGPTTGLQHSANDISNFRDHAQDACDELDDIAGKYSNLSFEYVTEIVSIDTPFIPQSEVTDRTAGDIADAAFNQLGFSSFLAGIDFVNDRMKSSNADSGFVVAVHKYNSWKIGIVLATFLFFIAFQNVFDTFFNYYAFSVFF